MRCSSESCLRILSSAIFTEAAAWSGGMGWRGLGTSFGASLSVGAEDNFDQSLGTVCKPQKFSGWSKRAPRLQLARSVPMGWQETTCAVVYGRLIVEVQRNSGF